MKMRSLGFIACLMIGGATTACLDGGDVGDGAELVGETESSVTTPQLLGTYSYNYTGFPAGVSFDVVQGGPCSPWRERSHFKVDRATGSGRCDAKSWYSNDPKDCRAWIHIGANWNEGGRCDTQIWEHPANVVIFEHANYGPPSRRFDPGWYDVGQLGIRNDELTSVRVPPGWSVTLFEHHQWNTTQPGMISVFTADTSHVGAINDKTSSILVQRGPGAPN